MELKDYTTEELKAELKRRTELAKAQRAEEMKIWVYRSDVNYPADDLNTEHFIEKYPERIYVYTKLYVCYDKPVAPIDTNTCRHIIIDNYLFPDIRPGEIVEFESTKINEISKLEE